MNLHNTFIKKKLFVLHQNPKSWPYLEKKFGRRSQNLKKSCSTSKYVEYISLTITRRYFFFVEISSLTSHQKKEFLIFVFLNIFSIFSQDVQSNLIFFCWWCCQIRLRKIEREKISIWRSFLKFRSWPTTFQLLKNFTKLFFSQNWKFGSKFKFKIFQNFKMKLKCSWPTSNNVENVLLCLKPR